MLRTVTSKHLRSCDVIDVTSHVLQFVYASITTFRPFLLCHAIVLYWFFITYGIICICMYVCVCVFTLVELLLLCLVTLILSLSLSPSVSLSLSFSVYMWSI